MEKKTECEIVQDLLPSYVDGVLNKGSQKLVEQHLAQCSKCQERLKIIQEDILGATKKQKLEKEIDYLKRYRIKARIKTTITVVVAFLFVFLIFYGYQFGIIMKLNSQYRSFLKKENIYIESYRVNKETQTLFVSKTWYQDGKYKKETYQRKEGEEEKLLFGTEYGSINEKEKIIIWEEEKKAEKVYQPWQIQKESILSYPEPVPGMNKVWQFALGAPFHYQISTDTDKIGKPYYILKTGKTQTWFDKESGLPIMQMGASSSVQYYEGTKIEKNIEDSVEEFRYQFDCVTEQDISMPDLTSYDVEENTSLVDLINQANEKIKK